MNASQKDVPASIRFTIITSTYNVGELLAHTATSIREQTHRNIQWIVVDGASTDNTLDVAHANVDIISTLISEPDRGIYDAWNKALPLIDGDWVLFLGAGDVLEDREAMDRVAAHLGTLPESITLAYGEAQVMDRGSGEILRRKGANWSGLDGPWVLCRPLLPCHQGVFHRDTLFRDGFHFDRRLKIAADNELLLREFLRGNGAHIPVNVSRFDNGGVSSEQRNRLRMLAETVFINFRVGIFFRRPVYQVTMLAGNVGRHFLCLAGLVRK